jgi:hypothetical protein
MGFFSCSLRMLLAIEESMSPELRRTSESPAGTEHYDVNDRVLSFYKSEWIANLCAPW